MGIKFWLMKTEPDEFSFNDLLQAPKQTAGWDGVRNYQARNFMRDAFKVGDQVLFYHSSIEEPAIVGLAEVVRTGYPDLSALNPKSDYYDAKAAKKGESPWVMVDVKAVKKFAAPVTLSMLRADKKFSGMMVIKKGQRLSIQPVEETHARAILKLGGV